jgi:hypothetical protein
MHLTQSQAIVTFIKDSLAAIAIVVGGAWALRRFWREREDVPRLQWTMSAKVAGRAANAIVVEVNACIENKGKVRHEIRKFNFNVFVITRDELNALSPGSSYLPKSGCFEGSLMPKDTEYSFIEPGVEAHYYELVTVPSDAEAIYIYARFDYGRKNEFDENECTLFLNEPSLSIRSGSSALPS